MLYQVLDEIERAQGPVLLNDISRKLDIDPQALMGMIEFWVRKGRLRDDDAAIEESASCASGCGDQCSGATGCAFVAKMPKTYSVPIQEVKSDKNI